MAQSNSQDVSAEVFGRKRTASEMSGKALIPPGIYNKCTVNLLGAKKFQNDDGTTKTKISIKFTCPETDADLVASMNEGYGPKASLGKLLRGCFPGLNNDQLAAIPLADLNGKVVNMVADIEKGAMGEFNTFSFIPVAAAKK